MPPPVAITLITCTPRAARPRTAARIWSGTSAGQSPSSARPRVLFLFLPTLMAMAATITIAMIQIVHLAMSMPYSPCGLRMSSRDNRFSESRPACASREFANKGRFQDSRWENVWRYAVMATPTRRRKCGRSAAADENPHNRAISSTGRSLDSSSCWARMTR
jgi:hypothetical protein